MRRAIWIGLCGVSLLAGCESGAKQSAGEPRPDIDTMQDAPQPEINFETYLAAGDLAASRGQHARAAEQYEKALKARANDASTMRKLAMAFVKAGQVSQSIETWKRYLLVTDYSADAYGSLGYAYELAGNPSEAERTYLAGIDKHPKGALAHINYGLMLVRRGKVDEAVQQLSAVLKPHEVNYNIASVYEQLGRRDLAQFYYRRSLECNPGFSPARQKLASVE